MEFDRSIATGTQVGGPFFKLETNFVDFCPDDHSMSPGPFLQDPRKGHLRVASLVFQWSAIVH